MNDASRTVAWRAVSEPRLTPTSHIVLGLIEALEPATPYDLKRFAAQSVTNFWAIPHTQLYSECGRLAGLGLLDEERESGGRRRRIYRLTKAGRDALTAWREDPEPATVELRDAAILKLFFGADPKMLAESQLSSHRERLSEFEELAEVEMPEGMRLALDAGLNFERGHIRFWESVAKGTVGKA